MEGARIVTGPDDVESHLAAIGITQEELHKALSAAFAGRQACGPFHPKSTVGVRGYGDGVAALREMKVAQGWTDATDPYRTMCLPLCLKIGWYLDPCLD